MIDSKDDIYDVADWVADSKVLAADSRAVSVSTNTLSSYYVMGVDVSGFNEVTSFCRDLLEGCYKEYVFYRAAGGGSTYLLFIGDSIEVRDGRYFVVADSLDDPVVYYRFIVSYDIVNRNLSRGSGTYRLPDFVEGNSLPTNQPYIFYYNRYHEDVSISVSYEKSESGTEASLDTLGGTAVVYSSLDGFPHLIEGVQNYAVAAFVLAFAVLAFKLIDRIFRRIY